MKQAVTIGKRIADLLEENNMTQRELANRINVTEVSVGRYVNDVREPKGSILRDIANALDVTTDYLLGSSEQKREQYYIDDETNKIAQELFEHPERKILLSASRKLNMDDVEALVKFINNMRPDE